ncbi:hypothetical protein BRAO375_4270019 [Bradyrhizobium sp. ORS 375]|nr:hypothetical protein BRAO375_4270019 [Bradyrhizobium sp. ORS 375]
MLRRQQAAQQQVTGAAQRAQGAVELDAGGHQAAQHGRIASEAAQDHRQVDIAVRLDRVLGKRRQRAVGWIGDDAQRGERQAVLGGIGGRDMALHVDGGSARLHAQRRLAGLRHHHFLGAGEHATHHAALLQRGAGDVFFAQRQAGQPPCIARGDLGGDDNVAGLEARIEAAGDAEADDAADRGRIEHGEQRAQLPGIARTADDHHARPGRDARLLHKSRHDQDRPRINRAIRGRVVPHPQLHNPTPDTFSDAAIRRLRLLFQSLSRGCARAERP